MKLLPQLLAVTVTLLFSMTANMHQLTSAAPTTTKQHFAELPSNFILSEDVTAEHMIYQYYRNLNDHNYRAVFSFEDPKTKLDYDFRLNAIYKKYNKVKVLVLKDVTAKPDFIPWDLSRYYAVKVYYGIIDARSTDPIFQISLDTFNHRRFLVVKLTKNGHWKLKLAQGYPAEEAEKLWG